MEKIRIILSGCSGRMGHVIADLAAAEENMEIAAGVDVNREGAYTFPVFKEFADCDVEGDVIIDFSSPKAFDGMMDWAEEKGVPAVVCTTGLSDDQISRLEMSSRKIAVLRSANMSLGVNVLLRAVAEVAKKLAPAGFDIEILEAHHNQKKDAPSGTAIALADSINEALDGEYHYVYNRADRFEKRDPKEIGISAVRAGNIPGTHSVIYAGTDEVIEIKHTAYSRAIFGKGALAAAKFLVGREPGYYSMADVIG